MTWRVPRGGLGIDVSDHQPTIDWSEVADDGVTFAVVKATEGNHVQDRWALGHVHGAETAGLTVAQYHFARPNPDADPVEDAFRQFDHYERYRVKRYPDSAKRGPAVLDWEACEPGYGPLDETDVAWQSRWIRHWATAAGREVVVYCDYEIAKALAETSVPLPNLWLAWWNRNEGSAPRDATTHLPAAGEALAAGAWNQVVWWQWCSHGHSGGVEVDLNVAVSDFKA